ncbi:hypothetical protein MAP00_007939 [Monascus purpureus]|nr:hypothetical protein MAP00_007939 [Monascus purpureus]
MAWYDRDGESTSRNPFKKFRRQPRRTNSLQLERGLDPVAPSASQSLAGPEHGDGSSLSHELSNFHRPPDTASSAPSSTAPLHIPTYADDNESDLPLNKPRKRRTLLGSVGEESPDHDNKLTPTSSEESASKKQRFTVMGQLRATIFNSWINVLLVAAPVGIALNYVDVDPVAVFVVNFIAIIPLAAMLSYATEEIALRTGETIGGLLNASFGNAVELIVAIIALVQDEVIIVQTSLIGSMLSNLLLVMGMCFFFGGLDRLEQHFNPVVAQTAASLLALAVGSLAIPTAFHTWSGAGEKGIAPLSRGTSVLLLVVYGCYLFFQLKTHSEIYNQASPKVEKRHKSVNEGDASRGIAQIGKMTATMGGHSAQQMELYEEEEEGEQPQLSIIVAVATLIISTVFVALCAEFMVDSIDALTKRGHISETFVGLILLPIVGNAAEHATAVTVACKDKMDLAIGVAVGSSMQIALLVLPLVVVIGWIMGKDDMTLYFDAFQIILLFVSILLVNYLIQDGKSHWLEGVLLMIMYLIIAVAAWFYPARSEPTTS